MTFTHLERKLTAIFYADVAGYSRLTGEDEEGTHRTLSRYLDNLTVAIENHGGRVVHYAGDAILAEFASVLKSLSCATAIQQKLKADNQDLPERRRLQFRIGINLGDVIVDRNEIYGDGVNVAARLEGLADPGSICISEAVRDAVGTQLPWTYEFMGEQSVKNITKPVRAYRVILETVTPPTNTSPIGRHRQLHQLKVMLQTCVETQHGQVIYLRGAAGIGKTWLVETLHSLASAQDFSGHIVQTLGFGIGKDQDVIRVLVRSLLKLSPGSDNEQTWTAAQQVMQAKLLKPEQQAFLNDLLNLPQPTEWHPVYEAMDSHTRQQGKQTLLSDLISRLSQQQPLLLVVEDIHWANAPILAYLAKLASTVNDCPALLLMTSRLDGEPSTSHWREALYAASPTTIDLGPLRNTESLDLARHIAGADNDFVRHCVERAGGNPLFLEQLLRIGAHSEDSPDSIQSIVWARLDQLNEMDKKAAQTAAVLGTRFSLPTLCFLLDEPRYNCDALIKHYLMRPEGEGYRFVHVLLQEAVYTSLAKSQRLALHRRAAAWFRDRNALLHAQHLEQAEDPAAAKAYLDAARRQIQVYRSVQALDLVQHGLLLSHDPDSEYELTCLHGELLRESGSIDAAIDEFQHALSLSSDSLRQCRARIGIALGFSSQGRHHETLAILEQAESHLQRQNSLKDLAQIYCLRGKALFLLGRIDDCLKAHEQAQKLAQQASSATLEAQALSGLGNAYYQRGQISTAHEHFNRCVQLCREQGLAGIETTNLIMRSLTHFYQNRLDNALQDALEAVNLAAKVGNQHDENLARHILGILQSPHGDWEVTKQQLAQSLTPTRRLESKHAENRSQRGYS